MRNIASESPHNVRFLPSEELLLQAARHHQFYCAHCEALYFFQRCYYKFAFYHAIHLSYRFVLVQFSLGSLCSPPPLYSRSASYLKKMIVIAANLCAVSLPPDWSQLLSNICKHDHIFLLYLPFSAHLHPCRLSDPEVEHSDAQR